MKKVCIVCGQELPIERFPENRRMPDGHLGWCFECFALRTLEGRLKAKKHEIQPVEVTPIPKEQPQTKEQSKPKRSPKEIRRRNRSEEYKERNRLNARRYYWEHREQCIANQKRYRQTEQGRQRKAESMREYRKTERYKAWRHERYLRDKEKKLKQQLNPIAL